MLGSGFSLTESLPFGLTSSRHVTPLWLGSTLHQIDPWPVAAAKCLDKLDRVHQATGRPWRSCEVCWRTFFDATKTQNLPKKSGRSGFPWRVWFFPHQLNVRMMWRMWTLFETHGKIFGWVKLKMRWKKKKWLQSSDGGPLLSKGAKSYSNRSSFHQGSLYYQPKKGSIVGEIPQNYPYLIHLHCLIPPKL